MTKSALRRSLLQQRQQMPRDQWQTKSQQICQHLQASPEFQQAQTVLGYFSFRQEPDLSGLWELPKCWGMPRCVEKSLMWHQWSPPDPVCVGAYGITEPDPDALRLSVEEVDLLLVPTVACDARGYRLGYGGGFYDRLFSDPRWAKKPAIAIVFDFAYLPELPNDPWDQPFHLICTESGLIHLKNRQS